MRSSAQTIAGTRLAPARTQRGGTGDLLLGLPRLQTADLPGSCDDARSTFTFNAVQINRYDHRWTHSEIHIDFNNEGPSRMIVLGDFEGGAFLIYDGGSDRPPQRITTRFQWIAFDGHHDHGSEPVTAGTRYSVIAFRMTWRKTSRAQH